MGDTLPALVPLCHTILMPKAPQGQKPPSAKAISRWETDGGATKKLSRKLPDDPLALGVAVMREATGQSPRASKKSTKPVKR